MHPSYSKVVSTHTVMPLVENDNIFILKKIIPFTGWPLEVSAPENSTEVKFMNVQFH
jgi:hypothetical protein